MTKPDDIPQDIWNTVQPEAMKYVEWIDPQYEHYDEAEHVLSVSFARAIMAEREACARVADERVPLWEEVEAVAAAIRNRGAAAPSGGTLDAA